MTFGQQPQGNNANGFNGQPYGQNQYNPNQNSYGQYSQNPYGQNQYQYAPQNMYAPKPPVPTSRSSSRLASLALGRRSSSKS